MSDIRAYSDIGCSCWQEHPSIQQRRLAAPSIESATHFTPASRHVVLFVHYTPWGQAANVWRGRSLSILVDIAVKRDENSSTRYFRGEWGDQSRDHRTGDQEYLSSRFQGRNYATSLDSCSCIGIRRSFSFVFP